jgi:hypothetical protein
MRQYKVFNYESEETIEADHFEFHRHQTVAFDEQGVVTAIIPITAAIVRQ